MFSISLVPPVKSIHSILQKNNRKGVAEQTEVPESWWTLKPVVWQNPEPYYIHWETNSQGTKTISQMKPNAKSSRSAPTPSSFASCSSPSSSSLNVSTWLSISTEKNTKKTTCTKSAAKSPNAKKSQWKSPKVSGSTKTPIWKIGLICTSTSGR